MAVGDGSVDGIVSAVADAEVRRRDADLLPFALSDQRDAGRFARRNLFVDAGFGLLFRHAGDVDPVDRDAGEDRALLGGLGGESEEAAGGEGGAHEQCCCNRGEAQCQRG